MWLGGVFINRDGQRLGREMAMPMGWENNPRHPYKWKRYLREFCSKNFLAMRMYSTRPQRSQRPGGIAYQSVAEGV
jgi:hypothetical protein